MPQILDRHYSGDQAALQPGVMGTIASTGITGAIGATTRALTFTNFPTNDTIWFNVGGLMVPATMPTPSGLTAGTIATSGQFAGLAIDAVPPTTPGGPCSYVVSKGTDQATAALASTNQAVVATGNIRVWDGIMAFTSPNYTLVAGGTGINLIPVGTGRDRRPSAKGYTNFIQWTPATAPSNTTTAFVPIDQGPTNPGLGSLSFRVECSGRPLVVNCWVARWTGPAGGCVAAVMMDGSVQSSGGFYDMAGPVDIGRNFHWRFTPPVGSHLIQPAWQVLVAAQTVTFNAPFGICLEVYEDMRNVIQQGVA